MQSRLTLHNQRNTEFSLTLHFSFRGNICITHQSWKKTACLFFLFFFLVFLQLGGLQILPVKAVSVLIEENLRVISCLCLWMSRCSSVWKC